MAGPTRRGRLAVAVTAGALVAAGCSLPGSIDGERQITAVFDDVGDLVPNHSVQVADVRIGEVSGIELTDDFQAEVTMTLMDDVALPADTVAVLRTTSLLGEKFIELRECDPERDGQCEAAPAPLADGAVIPLARTIEAPELEFVAEEFVEVLGGVVTDDLTTLIETGAVGFGGRGGELASIVGDLSTISGTLADQTGTIVSLIDGLDSTTATLAAGTGELDTLLVNLQATTELLVVNREQAITTLTDLTRLARTTQEVVFDPYLEATTNQIAQLDAILAEVAASRGEVGTLLDFLDQFVERIPTAIPREFAQVYAWFVVAPLETG